MKKLYVEDITNSKQFFPKKGTLRFLQDAHRETLAGVVKALIGAAYDPAVVYVLRGCVNTGTYPNYVISAGTIFYNGEVYDIDAATYTATGSDVAVFSTVQTQYGVDADPITYGDTTTANIHNIVKFRTTAAAAGSGIANYTQGFFLNFNIPLQLNLTAPITAPYVGNYIQVIGSYPNLQLYAPAPAANKLLFMGSHNIGNIGAGGYEDMDVTFGVTLSTASYMVVGTFVSNGTPQQDATIVYAIRSKTTTKFSATFREVAAVTQNVAFEYLIFAI